MHSAANTVGTQSVPSSAANTCSLDIVHNSLPIVIVCGFELSPSKAIELRLPEIDPILNSSHILACAEVIDHTDPAPVRAKQLPKGLMLADLDPYRILLIERIPMILWNLASTTQHAKGLECVLHVCLEGKVLGCVQLRQGLYLCLNKPQQLHESESFPPFSIVVTKPGQPL